MKRVVISIFIYCCIMVLGMIALLVLDANNVQAQRRQLAQVKQNLAEVQKRAGDIQNEFDDLARQQRQHRGQLDAENAIVVSQAVQTLNDQLTYLREQEEAAKAAVISNTEMLEKQQIQFVPHITLLMLHVIALWIFWPWRVFAIESGKPPRKKKWTPKKL